MPSRFCIAIPLCAAAWLRTAEPLCAQAPLALPAASAAAEEPEARVLKGKYRRPDFSAALFKAEDIPLSAGEIDALVHHLALLARNFPNDRRVSLDWRARALALALRLRPQDRDCVVANGQMARGVQPLALDPENSPRLEYVTVHFLNSAMTLMKSNQAAAKTLGIYLLDLACHLDASNREVFELFAKGAPPVDWKSLQDSGRDAENYSEEETADLRLEKAAAVLLLHTRSEGHYRPAALRVSATAQRLPEGSKKSMQLLLPEALRKAQEPELPKLRSLLRSRFDAWPAGWSIELAPVAADPPQQSGVALGIGLLMEAMLAGEPLDEAALTACGLDAASGNTTRICDVETLLRSTATAAPGQLLIIAGGSDEEISDFMVLHPERLADLARLILCEARTFGECVALSRANRPPALQRSLNQFAEIAARIRKGGLPVLRSAETAKDLDAVLRLNANLVSARYLNLVAQKKQPLTLSLNGSSQALQRLGAPILHAPGDPADLGPWKKRLETTPFAAARGRIDRLRPLLHPNARAFADALADLGRIYDAFLQNPPQTPQMKGEIMKAIRETRKRMQASSPK